MPSKGTSQPDDIIEDDLSRWPQLDIGEPPPELVEYAKKEIGEFAETRLQFCSELRDMIYERGECTPHRYDDLFLMRFLRARNFVVPRAHRLMVNYYRLREELSIDGEDKEDRSPMLELAQTLGEQGVISIPPHVDRTGRRLMVFRPGRWRPDECGVDELLRATLACMEIGVLEPRAQILGGICIFDLEGLRLEHAMQVTPYVAQRVVELMTTSFPMRVHAVHVVRAPWPFRLAWRAFKPLVDNEKRKRLHLHGSDFGQLHEHVGRDCLPVSLGGRRPDVNYKLWLIAMHENEKILHEMRSLGYRLHQHHIDELIKNNQHLIPSKPVPSNKIKASSTNNVEEENAITVL